MGLDQFAKRYTKDEWEKAKDITKRFYDKERGDEWDYNAPENQADNEELAYWRKHPNLQGWMENLWEKKGRPNFYDGQGGSFGDFNCVELELTLEDLDALESAVKAEDLPETEGFFFGNDSSDVYKERDLKFIADAREAIAEGDVVVYDSWW